MNIKNIKLIKAEIDKKKRAFQKDCQDSLHSLYLQLFAAYPDLEAVSFTGYTPYFCDGDECVYSVNSYTAAVTFNGISYGECEDDALTKGKIEDSWGDFVKILDAIPSEIFLTSYGDHCKTTIKRDLTVDSEEYEHD